MANTRLERSLGAERERLIAQLTVLDGRREEKIASIARVDKALEALRGEDKGTR